MPGAFERNNGKARFMNEHGMAKNIDQNTYISLNVLEADE